MSDLVTKTILETPNKDVSPHFFSSGVNVVATDSSFQWRQRGLKYPLKLFKHVFY